MPKPSWNAELEPESKPKAAARCALIELNAKR